MKNEKTSDLGPNGTFESTELSSYFLPSRYCSVNNTIGIVVSRVRV
jgi:hypothetical protein